MNLFGGFLIASDVAALVKRLERLEIVQGFQESNRRLRIEFAYLKQLPREYSGPRHIVTVGRRPDGWEECEERPREPPLKHEPEPEEGILAYRYPMADMEIQNGGQLIVRESQMAVFVDQGRIADVFAPGLHNLNTRNLPLLTDLLNWDKEFESPFKSDVYFFSTRLPAENKFCLECGKPIPRAAKFCPECGKASSSQG